jgi:hypothetical protein
MMAGASVRWAAALLVCAGAGVASAPASAGLFGPGKFQIQQINDRFSTGPTVTISGRNNRISKKSPVGGVYISDEGLYLEPLVEKNKSDGHVVRVGFFFHNEADITSNYGDSGTIGTPQRLIFIVDGSRQIVAPIVRGSNEFSQGTYYDSIGGYVSSGARETGLAYVQMDEMTAIAQAQSIAIKVEGSERAVIFDERDIAKSFLPNLATFRASELDR